VGSGTSSVASSSLDLPLRPSFGSAFRQVKTFCPGAKGFLGQQLFASGAELFAVLDGADAMSEGFIGSEFNRVRSHAKHSRNMPEGHSNRHSKITLEDVMHPTISNDQGRMPTLLEMHLSILVRYRRWFE
jgi:hypothetical protein